MADAIQQFVYGIFALVGAAGSRMWLRGKIRRLRGLA